MRFIHLIVAATLVAAAIDVYKIKFESTRQAQRVAKLRLEIRRERDVVAALRAEWAKLDAPLRLQGLAERHLALRPLNATQFDSFKNLPERPPSFVKRGDPDPIGAMIDAVDSDGVTGSVSKPEDRQ